MTGSRSTSARIISNDRLPAPMTIDARNSTTGTPLARSASPVSTRLFRCVDSDRGGVAESAQIDDAAHARAGGRAAEVSSGARDRAGESRSARPSSAPGNSACHAVHRRGRATLRRGSRPATISVVGAVGRDRRAAARGTAPRGRLSSSRRRRRPPMYPVAPVSRTGASMSRSLLARRQHDRVDHVNDAVARDDVGLHDARVVDRHGAVVRR